MRKLLREISVIPGVTGSCIFDKNAGAICSEFKEDLPIEMTESVGIHFVRLVQMGTMNNLNIKSANFRFDRYSIVGLPLDTGAILLAICDSDANCSLVATTALMLADDMRDELTSTGAGFDAAKGGERKGKAGEQFAQGDESDPTIAFKPQIEEMLKALAEAIGPVAGMVMSEYINKWSQNGPAEISRFDELITMLVEEIGDAGLAKEFQAKVKHLL